MSRKLDFGEYLIETIKDRSTYMDELLIQLEVYRKAGMAGDRDAATRFNRLRDRVFPKLDPCEILMSRFRIWHLGEYGIYKDGIDSCA